MKKKGECDAIDEALKQPEVDPSLTFFTEFKNWEEVPEVTRSQCRETMFANCYDESIRAELTKCLRVMPHH